MRALVGLALGFIVSTAVNGQVPHTYSSDKLLADCNATIQLLDNVGNPDLSDAVSCAQYINGFRDAMLVAKVVGVLICVPAGVTPGQLARVVGGYLKSHPEELHENRMFGVHKALEQAFPCK